MQIYLTPNEWNDKALVYSTQCQQHQGLHTLQSVSEINHWKVGPKNENYLKLTNKILLVSKRLNHDWIIQIKLSVQNGSETVA